MTLFGWRRIGVLLALGLVALWRMQSDTHNQCRHGHQISVTVE